LTPYRLSFAKNVKVLVGSDPQQEFIIHLDIITKRSWQFAENERRKKGNSTQEVRLPMYGSKTFDQYLHCLYQNEVLEYIQPPPTVAGTNVSAEQRVDSKFKSLVRLYSLARRLTDPVTESMVVDSIRSYGHGNHTPGPGVIELAFRSTGDDAKLRCLLADLYIFNDIPTHKTDYPRAFLELLAERFLHWRSSGGIIIDVMLAAKFKNDHQLASDEYHRRLQ
jgi:hypothetical protein